MIRSILFLFYLFMPHNLCARDYPHLFLYSNLISNPINSIMVISFGLREIYSDVLYVKLLQYYGTKEEGEGGKFDYGSGEYPLFYQKAREIIILNPYFKNAVLNSAGALAFNLKRVHQAIALLKIALSYDKDNYDYIILLSAILTFQSKNDIYDVKILNDLYEICVKKDSPVMLIQITAFIAKKAGKYSMALSLYEMIVKRAKDSFYVSNAKKQIEILRNIK